MSNLPRTPLKRKQPFRRLNSPTRKINNNTKNQHSKQQSARNFINWYKCMVDSDRQNLGLYLSDDVTLEWFGRTIKTKKKVSAFVKHDIQCSRHDFTTVENIDRIQTRNERLLRKDEPILASPLHSPEIDIPKVQRIGKRKLQRCGSPEWAEGCGPSDDEETIEIKKKKLNNNPNNDNHKYYTRDDSMISNNGDGVLAKRQRKSTSKTPPNMEIGQGDCLPSTSSTGCESPIKLDDQFQKQAVECNGFVEFTRTRNSRSTECMKWDRKCKVQISYSEDPLNVGEYIIWALRYSDESKCRRNLLAAFEDVGD